MAPKIRWDLKHQSRSGSCEGSEFWATPHRYPKCRQSCATSEMVSFGSGFSERLQDKKINPCVIPNSLEDLGKFLYGTLPNFVCYVYRNPPEPHQPSPEPCLQSAPQPSGTSSAICTRTLRNLISHLHRNPPERCLLCVPNPPEPCLLSAPEPSGTSSAICTRTRRNLISHLRRNHLHRNPPALCLLCVPEHSGTSSAIARTVSGTSSAICTGTRRNLVCYLHRNHPEPSGSSSAICAGTVRNLISFLRRNPLEPHQLSAPEPSGTFRNPPEPSPEPRVAAAPDRTRAILG